MIRIQSAGIVFRASERAKERENLAVLDTGLPFRLATLNNRGNSGGRRLT